jgi:predicted transcriptional regulator
MLQIRDVMTRHVFTVTPETTLREAAELFARHHISGAPVLACHNVVGVVSATDLLEFIASNEGRRFEGRDRSDADEERTSGEFDNEASALYFSDSSPDDDSDDDESFRMDQARTHDPFNDHTVAEVMTRNVCSLASDAEIGEAAQYMWQAGIHRLLVLDEGGISGILSMSDVARVVAVGRNPYTT